MNQGLQTGDIVQSKAGRDKDRYFVVYSVVDDDFVLVVDGTVRKQAQPKRKRNKHIKPMGVRLDTVAQKLIEGTHVFDAQIRKAMEDVGFSNKSAAEKKEG